VRTAVVSMAIVLCGTACASAPTAGPLGEGALVRPAITFVDSAFPPRHATVQLNQSGYVALLLVAPGHSATLLFPNDSDANNQFAAGAHQIAFQIPGFLAVTDSARAQERAQRGRDTSRLSTRARASRTGTMAPLPPSTPTYLLVVTSPQPLHYRRIIEKTAGVSIPLLDMEALNAVGKAIKSTIANEPREWAGYYRLVELRRQR
jgi:hypothetical protein